MTENKDAIKVASCTISELFSEKVRDISGSLEIPEYQRPYVWGEKEINKLLYDIKEYDGKQAEKPMYYLGNIVLHQHKNKLFIIDGQQRITTLAIIQHIKNTSVIFKMKYASPITIERIRKNYNLLKTENLSFISFDTINITLVVTDNEDDAYTFFETQNTGGVRLSGIDIIKAHHLRKIPLNGKQNEQYAITWEKQKNLNIVIEQLIKARRWNMLNWQDVPSDRDIKGTKNSIIQDFSEETNLEKATAYFQIISEYNDSIRISPYKLAIRQPLASGENFIDYLEQFAKLYQRLFKNKDDVEISDKYYEFNRVVITEIDGTSFLKEFYEIALLCYVNKFGIENLLEASFWIFRYTYSLRISNCKTVRENSIPAFLCENHYIFDLILASFNHEQIIAQLKQFSYKFSAENSEGDTVKARYIRRVIKYFGNVEKNNFDVTFKQSIENKLNESRNEKSIHN
jgi:hypothetical protein